MSASGGLQGGASAGSKGRLEAEDLAREVRFADLAPSRRSKGC